MPSTSKPSPRRARRLLALFLLLVAAPVGAQEALLASDFEWGDTADWSVTVPPRCDRLEAFGRWLVPTAELHVATTGNDTTGDGSAGNPFATIGRAARRRHAGHRHPGARRHLRRRHLSRRISPAPATAPIWIGGAPGEARPVIEGGGEGLHLSRGRYLVVHDLEVRNATANGINVDDGGDYANRCDATRFIVFRDLSHPRHRHRRQPGLPQALGRQRLLVARQRVRALRRRRRAAAASTTSAATAGCIARNLFDELSARTPSRPRAAARTSRSAWNRIADAGARGLNLGGSTGFEFFRPPLSTTAPNAEARDIRVIANVIVGGEAAVAFVGCVDCLAAQQHHRRPEALDPAHPAGDDHLAPYTFGPAATALRQQPRLLRARRALDLRQRRPEHRAGDLHLRQQPLVRARRPRPVAPSLPAAETGGIYGVDPALDPDYRIGPASPAAGTGQATTWTWGDLDGFCFAAPPSRGAFESR